MDDSSPLCTYFFETTNIPLSSFFLPYRHCYCFESLEWNFKKLKIQKKDHECEVCQFSATSQWHLQRHYTLKH